MAKFSPRMTRPEKGNKYYICGNRGDKVGYLFEEFCSFSQNLDQIG